VKKKGGKRRNYKLNEKRQKNKFFFGENIRSFPFPKSSEKIITFSLIPKKNFFCELVSSSLHESISATSQKGRRKREKKLSELSENCMKNAKRVK
jgi:hypothetical protein